MIQINGAALDGNPEEVIQALLDRDLTAAMVAITMCSWEESHNDKLGDAGWDYGPGLFMIFRAFPDEEAAKELAARGAMGQGMAMRNMELPDGVQTKQGPSLQLMLHTIARGLKDNPDIARMLYEQSPDDKTWEFCAWMAVTEAFMDTDPNRRARLAIAADRAKVRYCLARERGTGDDDRILYIRLNDTRFGDDTDEISDGLIELVDSLPDEEIPT